jgi:nucleotide-binding universal stress UspA family protein
VVEIARILCPVDLSDVSRRALEHAAAFARWYDAKLAVLHVFSPYPVPVAGSEFGGYTTPPPPLKVEDVVEAVRRFCEPLVEAGMTPEVLVREGVPATAIVEQVGQMGADLLVMGTHGRSGFERLILGSVTEKVVRRVRCPVLTVPPPLERKAEHSVRFKAILCPVDFSPSSVRALEYGLTLAREADARLVVLHVSETTIDDALAGEAAHFSVPEYHRHVKADALERLSGLIPAEAREWCKPEPMVTSGRPYREILRVAADMDADVIVMGVQGRGAVDVALFGSTTNHVIRTASCPVLTLRS